MSGGRKLPYREGDVFAVPLRDGGYGIGVVARMDGRGIVLGYFFGERHDDPPEPGDVHGSKPADSVHILRFGDLGLIRGEWPVIGPLPGWNREEWPMPAFGRQQDLTGRCLRVEYPHDDPSGPPREVEISSDELAALPEDGLAGFGFVEVRLTRLLAR
jgi:hypothetical protein